MQPIAALAVLAALCIADVAAAASARARHHRPAAHATGTRSHQASRIGHRRRARQHPTTLAASQSEAKAAARPYRAANDDQGVPSRPGFFRSDKDKEAGWGFSRGATQTVVGVYQRPPQPDIPGPQIYHHPESRGAAGLSLSLKLGK